MVGAPSRIGRASVGRRSGARLLLSAGRGGAGASFLIRSFRGGQPPHARTCGRASPHQLSMSRAPPSNCLFLPELPSDLTDAVLERHFRGFVGFTSARTRSDRNGKLVGFVEFDAVDDAVRARDSMQGQSPFEGISWHIHFSNNTKSTPKRPREEAAEPVGRSDAQRLAYSGGGGGGGGGMCAPHQQPVPSLVMARSSRMIPLRPRRHDQRPGYDRPQHQMMQPPPPMMQQQSPNTYGPPPGPMYGGGGPMMAPPVPNGSPMHVSPPWPHPSLAACQTTLARPPARLDAPSSDLPSPCHPSLCTRRSTPRLHHSVRPQRLQPDAAHRPPPLTAKLPSAARPRRLEHPVCRRAPFRCHRARGLPRLPPLRGPCTRRAAPTTATRATTDPHPPTLSCLSSHPAASDHES